MKTNLLSLESPLIRWLGIDVVSWMFAVLVQVMVLSLLALFGPSRGGGGSGNGSGGAEFDATFDTVINSTGAGPSGSAFVLDRGRADSKSPSTAVTANSRTSAVEHTVADGQSGVPTPNVEPESDAVASDVSNRDSELLVGKLNGVPGTIGGGRGEGESVSEVGRGRGFGRGDGPGHGRSTSFFGIASSAKKLVYVIDRSDSMALHGALSAVKAELLASLDELPLESEFAVLFFNRVLTTFSLPGDRPGVCLVRCTTDNRALAREFVDNVIPEGGTDRMAALKSALALNPDVIYLLTDADEPLLYAGDLEMLRRGNRRRIPIHVVEFGRGASIVLDNFLMRLARESRSKYTYLDITKFAETKTGSRLSDERR